MKKILLYLILSINIFAFKMENITYNRSINNGYREYKIYNEGLSRIRYKAELLPAGEEDITDCLEVYPKVLTIEPQTYQVLKIFGDSDKELEKKEYKFYLSFKQLIIPKLEKGDEESISGTGILGITPKIEMRGYGGKIDFSKDLSFENVNFFKDENGNLQVNGDIINNSYGSVEIGMNFRNIKRTIANSKGLGEIVAKSRKNVTIPLLNFTDVNDIATITFYNDVFEELKVMRIKNGKIID